MIRTHTARTRRRLAGALLATAGLMSTLAGPAAITTVLAPTASAAITGVDNHPPLSSIDTATRGSLTVTVPSPNPYDDGYNDPVPFGGVAGTQITATRLPVDITTQEGWDAVRGMNTEDVVGAMNAQDFVGAINTEDAAAQANAQGSAATESYDGYTDTNGSVTIANLPIGAYLVQATPPTTEGYWFVHPAATIVTLPLATTGAEGSAGTAVWEYNPQIITKIESTDPTTPPATTPDWATGDPLINDDPTEDPNATDPADPSDAANSAGNNLGNLAMTGANVILAVGLAAMLTALGVVMIAHVRQRAHTIPEPQAPTKGTEA